MTKQTLDQLKLAMCTIPMLAMSNFTQIFVIESDAYRVVYSCMRNAHPLAFISKALTSKNIAKSTYEMEMIAGSYSLSSMSGKAFKNQGP